MDKNRKIYEFRITLIGLFFSLFLSVLFVRVVYLTFFMPVDVLPGRAEIDLIAQKTEIVDEGERLDYILSHLEDMTINEMLLEINKTRKYIASLKDKTDKELKSLKKLSTLVQAKEKEIESLQQKQITIEKLQDSDIELLRTLVLDNSRDRTLTSFFTGVITSLIGAYLFYYRKILRKQLSAFTRYIIVSFKESWAERKKESNDFAVDLDEDKHGEAGERKR